MKKILPFIVMLLFATAAEAQLIKPKKKAPVTTEYQQGAVPIENNRVVFRHKIEAPGLSAQEIMQRVVLHATCLILYKLNNKVVKYKGYA